MHKISTCFQCRKGFLWCIYWLQKPCWIILLLTFYLQNILIHLLAASAALPQLPSTCGKFSGWSSGYLKISESLLSLMLIPYPYKPFSPRKTTELKLQIHSCSILEITYLGGMLFLPSGLSVCWLLQGQLMAHEFIYSLKAPCHNIVLVSRSVIC